MQRGLVAVGYAVGVALVAAHRRGLAHRVPRPYVMRWNEQLTRGVSVGWLGTQVDVIRRQKDAW